MAEYIISLNFIKRNIVFIFLRKEEYPDYNLIKMDQEVYLIF